MELPYIAQIEDKNDRMMVFIDGNGQWVEISAFKKLMDKGRVDFNTELQKLADTAVQRGHTVDTLPTFKAELAASVTAAAEVAP